MGERGWIWGLLCLAAAGAALLWSRWKTGRTLRRLEEMLDDAMEGKFSERWFDESRLSALETRFARYLAAAETSGRNVAREKDKLKTLIADISHQTKTPIANLRLYSELLLEEELPPSAMESARAVAQQTEKLSFLISSLVKLSRLESGIVTLSPRTSPLQPLLESVGAEYAMEAGKKGLRLTWEATELSAVFDPRWTREALANIVDNAVKYTARGGVTLSALSYEMFVRIDVADSGAGIPESEQARIFSRFYRSERTSAQPGVGIELYLARQIVNGEGGYIKVSSVPGEGSRFSIYLPR